MRESRSTFYDSQNDYRSYLSHHGVKGQKWGVRRYEKQKAKYMKKYKISSKDYDDVHKIAKVKSEPARKVMKTVGKVIGGLEGLGVGSGIGMLTTGTLIGEAGMSTAAAVAIGTAVGPALAVPVGVAAGSAIFGIGANILESAMRDQAAGERALQTQNEVYNDIRTRNVRKV